jgi:ribosomal protein L11 methyltransferase
MGWIELELVVERTDAPLLEAALENAGALAVTLEECTSQQGPASGSVGAVLEPAPGATPLWEQLRIKALFDDSPEGQTQATAAAGALARYGLQAPSLHPLEERVWERVWLEGLAPQRFGRRLWVCPRGQQVAEPGAVVVDLDPGLAFGTGHHPTTALCLEWLDGTPLAGQTLIDVGCGSGILAIAALKLGAARAIAIDHDPQALEATLENAAANGVAEHLEVRAAEPLPTQTADIVIANILAAPLVELAPALIALTKPGGLVALSGVLADQADAVASAYDAELSLEPHRQRDDWMLISGRRPAPQDV